MVSWIGGSTGVQIPDIVILSGVELGLTETRLILVFLEHHELLFPSQLVYLVVFHVLGGGHPQELSVTDVLGHTLFR
jgi:hypothetical protein